MSSMEAGSLGLAGGHETYAYTPEASSLCFTPGDDLALARNCSATMCFPPVAAADDYCFPELSVHPPAACYASPPPPPQVLSKNETNYTGFVDDERVMVSGAVAAGTNSVDHHHHRRTPSSSSRIGFRTRSAVDVLDDGFRWRKYGKKAVKSSPNPRNYYRCTVEGCGVKKRVERDRHDPRYVLTTYDGVHNHAAAGAAAGHRAQSTTLACAPSEDWGMHQLHAAASTTAQSSESSYRKSPVLSAM